MSESVLWLLIFGVFITLVFILGIFYSVSEFHSLKEPEQRREHDEEQGARINEEERPSQ